jgi:hypothetical protein
MRREVVVATMSAAFLTAAALGCGDTDRGGGEVPTMLRVQFQTRMKTILHDVRVAEEMAAVYEGGYMTLDKLRGSYLNAEVPDAYQLTLSEVSGTGYRAEVVHKASGLRCRLVVSSGQGRGVPVCD